MKNKPIPSSKFSSPGGALAIIATKTSPTFKTPNPDDYRLRQPVFVLHPPM
jgi:hypothetical protein